MCKLQELDNFFPKAGITTVTTVITKTGDPSSYDTVT
jgi:hypothetical protein